jgi:hypothetical protein
LNHETKELLQKNNMKLKCETTTEFHICEFFTFTSTHYKLPARGLYLLWQTQLRHLFLLPQSWSCIQMAKDRAVPCVKCMVDATVTVARQPSGSSNMIPFVQLLQSWNFWIASLQWVRTETKHRLLPKADTWLLFPGYLHHLWSGQRIALKSLNSECSKFTFWKMDLTFASSKLIDSSVEGVHWNAMIAISTCY